METIKKIASSIMYASEGETLAQVLERIAHLSRDLVKARYAALGVPDGHGGLEYFVVSGITAEQIAKIHHEPVGLGLLGAIMHERKTLRLPRMLDDERATGFPEGHPTMTSLLGVPVQVGEQLFGMLYLTDREDGQPFSDDDQWLIETMATYAAIAIAGTRLRDQQNRLTLLEERERIGMELHDGIIQSLYAVGMQLDIMRLGGAVQSDDLKPVIDNLNTVIEDIRTFILNLKAKTSQKSVQHSIEDLVSRLHIPRSIQVDILAPNAPPPFTPSAFDAICLMAGEAVSNAVRHANASEIQIRAAQQNAKFQISIADNGSGFDLDEMGKHTGLGLRNIRQRVLFHGGDMRIDTAPGKGTRLTIEIPIWR